MHCCIPRAWHVLATQLITVKQSEWMGGCRISQTKPDLNNTVQEIRSSMVATLSWLLDNPPKGVETKVSSLPWLQTRAANLHANTS